MRLTAKEKSLLLETIDKRIVELRRNAKLRNAFSYPEEFTQEADQLQAIRDKITGVAAVKKALAKIRRQPCQS